MARLRVLRQAGGAVALHAYTIAHVNSHLDRQPFRVDCLVRVGTTLWSSSGSPSVMRQRNKMDTQRQRYNSILCIDSACHGMAFSRGMLIMQHCRPVEAEVKAARYSIAKSVVKTLRTDRT